MSLIKIRSAQLQDAPFAAPLICEAMGDLIDKFTGGHPEDAIGLFELFFQKENNQYSYNNCQIAEYDGVNAGMVLTYDGKDLHRLRTPFLDYLATQFGENYSQMEDEATIDELYIDCLAVLPTFRGKSIGTALIDAAIEKSKKLHLPNVGLLVDVNNEKARQLYNRIGFKEISNREFVGGEYWHMQYANT